MADVGDWLPPNSHSSVRPYAVYGDAADLSDAFRARLFLLLVRPGDTAGGIVLAREETDDAPAAAAHLRDVFEGRADLRDRFGHADPERTMMLRANLTEARRQLGPRSMLAFAVRYGKKVRRVVRPVEFPTREMLDALGQTVTMGGRRWAITQDESALPAGPGRAVLALVAFDSRGRLCDALPQPALADLDRWGGRNLRELARAFMAHPDRAVLDTFCTRHGLEPVWAFRWIDKPKVAA